MALRRRMSCNHLQARDLSSEFLVRTLWNPLAGFEPALLQSKRLKDISRFLLVDVGLIRMNRYQLTCPSHGPARCYHRVGVQFSSIYAKVKFVVGRQYGNASFLKMMSGWCKRRS